MDWCDALGFLGVFALVALLYAVVQIAGDRHVASRSAAQGEEVKR